VAGLPNRIPKWKWQALKYEEVYLHEYTSPKDAYGNLSEYITFYNYDRPPRHTGRARAVCLWYTPSQP